MPVLFPIILLSCFDPLEAVVGQVSGPKLILDMPHHFRFLIILGHGGIGEEMPVFFLFFLARDKIGH